MEDERCTADDIGGNLGGPCTCSRCRQEAEVARVRNEPHYVPQVQAPSPQRGIDTNAPRLWVCYQLHTGELKVDCLLCVPGGEGVDRAAAHAKKHGAVFVHCSRERLVFHRGAVTFRQGAVSFTQGIAHREPDCPFCGCPEQACDCHDRATCEFAGERGHYQCGMCKEHDKPRFACGCGYRKRDGQGR